MNANKESFTRWFYALVALALLATGAARAQTVEVTSADPSSALQGTVSLDVTVGGNGFDSTAQVEFLVTGTTDPGGITVKKVQVRGSKKLIATIDVAESAVVDKFDVVVTLGDGRKGKGTTLFAVLKKTVTGACASVTGAPGFAFTTRPGNYMTPQVYVADASGACTRFVGGLQDGPYYYPWPQRVSYRLLSPAADGTVTGRIVAEDQARGLVLMQFALDPGTAGMEVRDIEQFVLGFTGRGELSPDGRRLAAIQLSSSSPSNYTYRLLVVDVDVCIADLPNCTPSVAYVEAVSSDGYGILQPRWGSGGHIYLEKRTTGKLIDPSIVRVSSDPPYSTALEFLVPPTGPRLALFDVETTASGDVIVFGETTAKDPYCYVVKTARASSCGSGTCTISATNLQVSYYTSAESVEPTIRVLTQPLKRDCSTNASIARGEAIEGSSATIEPLVTKGEVPSSAR